MLVALPLEHSLDGEGKPLFAVKGGVSMELRLGLRARTTKDFDAVFRGAFEDCLALYRYPIVPLRESRRIAGSGSRATLD